MLETINIVVMGGGGVGKSALTVQYVQNIFVEKYDPTIEDSYRKQTEVNGRQKMIEILDTAGTEQFTAMRDLYVKNANGAILVISLTARSGIRDVEEINEQINRIHDNKTIPKILCANKCDLEDDFVYEDHELEKYANELEAVLFKTSAKTRYNVVEMFDNLLQRVDDVMQKDKVIKKKKRRCMIL